MHLTSSDLVPGYIISDRSDKVARMVLDSTFTHRSDLSSQYFLPELLHSFLRSNFFVFFFFFFFFILKKNIHVSLEICKLSPISVIPEEQVQH